MGDFYRGFANGYVAKCYEPGGVPGLTGGVRDVATAKHPAPSPPPNPYTADATVFVREATNVRVE